MISLSTEEAAIIFELNPDFIKDSNISDLIYNDKKELRVKYFDLCDKYESLKKAYQKTTSAFNDEQYPDLVEIKEDICTLINQFDSLKENDENIYDEISESDESDDEKKVFATIDEVDFEPDSEDEKEIMLDDNDLVDLFSCGNKKDL